MKSPKQILSLVFKIALGIACISIVYLRLQNDFGPDQELMLKQAVFKASSLISFMITVMLIPVNWGLESKKWQLITEPIEKISFPTAMRSVYSGVCLGNFAPGRATEFVGKVLYFSDENKSKVTILHFITGLIQLSITLLSGFSALLFTAQNIPEEQSWMMNMLIVVSALLLICFALAVLKLNSLLNWAGSLLAKKQNLTHVSYYFPILLWVKLFFYSALRYSVFMVQFLLLLKLFAPSLSLHTVLPGMALYFMISSLLPMISIFEAAIRAAIALLVLGNSGIAPSALALSTLILWLNNIVFPSALGYFALLRMQFDFKLFLRKRK